jgi:hypothetical protein
MTVAKGKKRPCAHDAPMGPKNARSTILNPAEEAMVVAFRKHTLLPLNGGLYTLQPSLPPRTRSSGYFHIHIAEGRTEEGKLYLFVAIDRTSTFAYAELPNSMTKPIAAHYLRHLITSVPYKIQTVLQITTSSSPIRPGINTPASISLAESATNMASNPGSQSPTTPGRTDRLNA